MTIHLTWMTLLAAIGGAAVVLIVATIAYSILTLWLFAGGPKRRNRR